MVVVSYNYNNNRKIYNAHIVKIKHKSAARCWRLSCVSCCSTFCLC